MFRYTVEIKKISSKHVKDSKMSICDRLLIINLYEDLNLFVIIVMYIHIRLSSTFMHMILLTCNVRNI